MRKYIPWIKPRDVRFKTKFLFLPKWIGEEIRWLEMATWREVAVRNYDMVSMPLIEWEARNWI